MKIIQINCDNVNLNPISITSSKPCNNLELLDALYDTLSENDSLDTDHLLKIPSQRRRSPSLSEERSKYEVTAKVFVTGEDYNTWNVDTINDALDCLRRTTSLDSVDSLILSFNGILNDANDSNQRLDAAARVWKSLSPAFPNTDLGVADFGPIELDNFVHAVKDSGKQPRNAQISLADCCEPPADLVDTAKKHGIELTAHPDIHDILSPAELAAALNHNRALENGTHVQDSSVAIDWVLKYTIVAHGRGVVADKGYIIRASLS